MRESKEDIMINNSLQKKSTSANQLSIYLSQSAVKARINELIGSDRGTKFISSILAATQNNKSLQECTPQSIVSGALQGEALNLSPSPQLGHFYLVPFNNKTDKEAQFQVGYKGFIQLAIRSGQYKSLNVLSIKKGELIRFNPLTEDIEVKLIEDEELRENTETIGYYAYFEYLNGFRKSLYWSKSKMEAHALRYSMGYRAKKGYTFWEKDFDAMAIKTMIRQLISKWGIMSVEMQQAYNADMAVIREDGSVDYVDNSGAEFEETKMIDEPKEPTKEIPTATQATKSKEDIENEFFTV